jgi:hypothetical protein
MRRRCGHNKRSGKELEGRTTKAKAQRKRRY